MHEPMTTFTVSDVTDTIRLFGSKIIGNTAVIQCPKQLTCQNQPWEAMFALTIKGVMANWLDPSDRLQGVRVVLIPELILFEYGLQVRRIVGTLTFKPMPLNTLPALHTINQKWQADLDYGTTPAAQILEYPAAINTLTIGDFQYSEPTYRADKSANS